MTVQRDETWVAELASEFAAVLRELASTDIADRVSAVEQLAHVTNKIVDRVLEEFARPGSARYLIFERLGRFGSLIVEPLEQLLIRGDDHELRVLTAAALLSLGSRAVKSRPAGCVCVAARVSADAGVEEAQSRIEEAVYQCDISNTAVLECLVAALHRFSDHLSGGVIARLQLVEPAWLRESLFRMYLSHSDAACEDDLNDVPDSYFDSWYRCSACLQSRGYCDEAVSK